MNVYLSDNGIFRKKNKNGAIWSLPLSAAVFYMTPVASDGIRSKFPPEVMRKSKDGANLAAQVILEEQPQSETAALNPDWVEWLMGFPKQWTDLSCGNGEPVGVPRITDRTDGRADRLKALGNAVCPPQVFPILKFISDIETGRCKKYCEFGGEQI